MPTSDPLDVDHANASAAADGAREVIIRALVTLSALAAVWMLRYVPLPYLELFQVEEADARSVLSVGALGLSGWITAFVLVEFAALIVPSLERRRDAGPEARAPLRRAALLTGLVLTAIQALGIALWIDGTGLSIAATSVERFAQFVAILAGPCAALLAAAIVSSRGLGDGFALFLVLDPLTGPLATLSRGNANAPLLERTSGVWLLLAALVVGAALTRFRSQRLPGPISGIAALYGVPGVVPMSLVLSVVGTVTNGLATLQIPLAVRIGAVAAATVAFGLAFTPPGAAQAALVRAGVVPDALAARREYVRALFVAVAAVAAVVYASWELAPPALAPLLIALIPLTAYVLDIAAEARFRWQYGRCFVVDELHRPYLLAERIASLPSGTPVLARGLCFRSLLQFFGPFVPILLLVPQDAGEQEHVQEPASDEDRDDAIILDTGALPGP